MNTLWWLALSVLALPIWWHRQKRQRIKAEPLATARFLPRSKPEQLRVWRWTERLLLLLRCLLLACLVAWLADAVVPWRSDTVLIVPGTDAAWAGRQIREAGLMGAHRIDLPSADAIAWLRLHEREWQADARLLVVGEVPMPARLPQLHHSVELRSKAVPVVKTTHRIAIVSKRAQQWRALFAALDGPQRYMTDAEPNDRPELLIWDIADAPAAGLHAPLWWVGDATAFPELKNAATVDGLRYMDSARGRLWSSAAWPPLDADSARALFEKWQRLHYAPVAFPAPSQVVAATPSALSPPAGGALREWLMLALIVLFALERILAHARGR
jgi:Aerotolerance regulator N-terminal